MSNGLDHIAFHCADRDELATWVSRLDALGIAHSEILDEWYGSGLSFRDPDNIALKLVRHTGTYQTYRCGFSQTETCAVLSPVKGARCQFDQRSRRVRPAICAIRSYSAGHA